MSKKNDPNSNPPITPQGEQVIDVEILEGEYIPTPKAGAKRYYKSAEEFREQNSFGNLFGELLELLTPEDLQQIEETVAERRGNRRHRLKTMLLEHEAQAGDIQEAEAELNAIKAHLISVDPELSNVFAAYDRHSETAYKRGKKEAAQGIDWAEIVGNNHSRSGGYTSDELTDPWAENSQGASVSMFGIEF